MLTRDEMLALDVLTAAQAVVVPEYVANERGEVDEAASEALRRTALDEREVLRSQARALSSALVDAVEAEGRGYTIEPYSTKAMAAIRAAVAGLAELSGGDPVVMAAAIFASRDRAIALQRWTRSMRAEAAA